MSGWTSLLVAGICDTSAHCRNLHGSLTMLHDILPRHVVLFCPCLCQDYHLVLLPVSGSPFPTPNVRAPKKPKVRGPESRVLEVRGAAGYGERQGRVEASGRLEIAARRQYL